MKAHIKIARIVEKINLNQVMFISAMVYKDILSFFKVEGQKFPGRNGVRIKKEYR